MHFVISIIILFLSFIYTFHRLEILQRKFNSTIFFLFTNLSVILSFFYYLLNLIYYSFYKEENFLLVTCKHYITFYMLVVMLVYHFVLVPNEKRKKTANRCYSLSSNVAHIILPCLLFLDWFFFTEHQKLSIFTLILSLLYPIFYCCLVFYKGIKKTGKVFAHSSTHYPYFFLDIELLGLKKVIMTVIILLIILFLLGYLFLCVNNYILV